MIEENLEQPEESVEDGLPADPSVWPGAQPKQAAFLTAFVIVAGSIVKAAKAAKIARSRHYQWLESDENYLKLFTAARAQAADVLESDAIEMCHEGVLEPIYYMGVHVGNTRRFPYVGMHQFLLRGLKPEVYNRDRVEHTGKDGGPIEIVERLQAGRDRLAKQNDTRPNG
jgi:hypothetical protein